MESLIIILVGVLSTVAFYLLLSRNIVRVILGTAILSHAAHLMILAMGGLKIGSAPLLGEEAETYVDALPQALILTAIVISFAVTAFILVLAYRAYQELGTDDLEEMRGTDNE
ncbi:MULTISPECIES: Na(+)/H(+) antiporter subunit C [Planococcus]|uniref:Na(+)/H(+) antiporter subunit C n=1 Tax=Planococcus maitriensis TaxID=221799 RepID=A0A365K3S1_9BACL|nr:MULTISPECIES: Na(+)/H(+) antiporter subunit C [Planococcus]MDE4084391.1 Na(+)/H(+) antiporter subunit C [Planococcus maritimus]AUD13205.1 Na(+)/H(+) antiporter subunit C [Planococcus sp. MB-3u-03]PKG45307.1 Na(+)/H(+) antiporter subunit C [Planococcus sp. Urea-trap-24]PKG89097.1 Na(+)/H(+) antiporter subunit C [Planococcus sp. Urea-3u-39]PKH39312.1 Na(+)/H(+) antiporter subunit C [Planococcus sp. MB-3u-09]